MTIPVPLDELRQQLFDLQFRLVELDEAIARLSNELKDLLSLGPQGEPWLVWPLAEVRVDTHPIDVEAAVQIGLARRPEVGLLRRLDSMQSSDTMRALQLSLSMVNPLLGMSCGSSALSHRTMPLFLHSRGNESEDLASLRASGTSTVRPVSRRLPRRSVRRHLKSRQASSRSSSPTGDCDTGRTGSARSRPGKRVE